MYSLGAGMLRWLNIQEVKHLYVTIINIYGLLIKKEKKHVQREKKLNVIFSFSSLNITNLYHHVFVHVP